MPEISSRVILESIEEGASFNDEAFFMPEINELEKFDFESEINSYLKQYWE